MWRQRGERTSFLKKRSKRLLRLCQRIDPGLGRKVWSGKQMKISCFFFQERSSWFA
jgi:hypothetical protein